MSKKKKPKSQFRSEKKQMSQNVPDNVPSDTRVVSTTPTGKRILKYLTKAKIPSNAYVIAQRINGEPETIRKYCRWLEKEGKIQSTKTGRVNTYTIITSLDSEPPKSFAELPSVTQRQYPPEVHGLVFHYRGGTGTCTLPQGGSSRGFQHFFYVHRWISRFQHYPDKVDVWINCSDNPMDGDGFLHFLGFLEGWSGLPVIRGQGCERWWVSEYGLGIDWGVMIQNNQPSKLKNVRLSVFGTTLLEFYGKHMPSGSIVQRTALHRSGEFIQLANFLELIGLHLAHNDRVSKAETKGELEQIRVALGQLVGLFGAQQSQSTSSESSKKAPNHRYS